MTDLMIRAHPSVVPWSRERGTTTIAWDAGATDADVVVTVSIDDGPEEVFAGGQHGAQEAPWIDAGTDYRFRLRVDPDDRTISPPEVAVTMAPPPADVRKTAFLRATPARVPPASVPGTTTIEWNTGDGSPGTIMLVMRTPVGDREHLLTSGPSGSVVVDWIMPDVSYRFRLYSRFDRHRPLAAINVSMALDIRAVALDVAIVTSAVVGLVILLVSGIVAGRVLVWFVRRLWGAR